MLEICGNILVMLAILYALLQLGLRYGNLSTRPSSHQGSSDDQTFKELCTQIAISSHLINVVITNALHNRVHQPGKVG